MKMKLVLLLILGIWLGMLIGISFVEAPLKFRAPNITLPLGLGIGKLVFGALNKFEIAFSIVLTAWLILEYKALALLPLLAFASLIILVLLQSVWLLPLLSLRADTFIAGETPPPSYHHLYYIIMEVAKVGLLFFGFIKAFNYDGHL